MISRPHSNPGPDSSSAGDTSAVSLSVVIPAFNEARRLGLTLESIRSYATRTASAWEVIVVDDGSRDGTGDLVQRFDRGCLGIRLLVIPRNVGKGFAVRDGVLAADGAAVLMCDADLSTPIEEVEKLLPWIEQGYDVVIGSRRLPDSLVDPRQPPVRRVMDAVFRRLRRLVMLRDLYDTQCGFKCFKRSVARRVFPLLTVPGFGFDCEALWLARNLNYRIKEVAVRWGDDPDSRVRPVRDACKMLYDLLVIRRRHRRTNPPAPGTDA